MRRADRLFRIVQTLRARGVTTAAALAEHLSVSERTIYRDVRDLVRGGIPIEGEAGVGYALPAWFELPPLMFTPDEIEALVLGARMVEAWGGDALAARARAVLEKVQLVVPGAMRRRLLDVGLFAPSFHVDARITRHLEPLRLAIATQRKLSFAYTGGDGSSTHRTVRPLGLYFWGKVWTAVAWCELRDAFRTFRPDRMDEIVVLDDTFADEPGRDLASFLRAMAADGRRGEDPRAPGGAS